MLLVGRFGTTTLLEGKRLRPVHELICAFWHLDQKTSSWTVTCGGIGVGFMHRFIPRIMLSQSRLFLIKVLWWLPNTHTDIYPSAKMSLKYMLTQRSNLYILLLCLNVQQTRQPSALYSLSLVCHSYKELCFYVATGSL